jgi:hypothetical protein
MTSPKIEIVYNASNQRALIRCRQAQTAFDRLRRDCGTSLPVDPQPLYLLSDVRQMYVRANYIFVRLLVGGKHMVFPINGGDAAHIANHMQISYNEYLLTEGVDPLAWKLDRPDGEIWLVIGS